VQQLTHTDGRTQDFKRGSADRQPCVRSNYQQNPYRPSPPCWTRQTGFVDVVENSHKCPRKNGGGEGKQALGKRRCKSKNTKTPCSPVSTRYPKQNCFVWRLPGFVRPSFWLHEYHAEDEHGALVKRHWQGKQTCWEKTLSQCHFVYH